MLPCNEPMGDMLAYLENEARPVEAPVNNWASNHVEELKWINTSTFDFAVKMREVYMQWGRLTERQLAAVQKCMASERAYKERQAVETNHGSTWGRLSSPTSTLDLSKVPDGRYAVPGGDTRLKVQIDRGVVGTRWEGYIFVKDAAAYGQGQRYGMQRPGQSYQGQIVEQLTKIVSNPGEASRAYGRLVGRCGVCGRKLEDAASVAAGIGPICAGKF